MDISTDSIVREALFTDGSENFIKPAECDPGDSVVIRFRTYADNADKVLLHNSRTRKPVEMQKTEARGAFDFYEAAITVGKKAVRYFFEIQKGTETLYYYMTGLSEQINKAMPRFVIIPGFHVPDWSKGAVMYQIFVDRFCNGDETNDVRDDEYRYLGTDVEHVEDWGAPVSPLDVGRFYGGDLQGVLDKLDYLKQLGIEVIYLNPVFVSPSNHKYDTQDYDHVDPHITVIKKDGSYVDRTTDPENLKASDAFFADFVKRCHEKGIKVILDGVFNHCGSFNKLLDRERFYENTGEPAGAYRSADSKYRSFFRFADEKDSAWPGNTSYEQWWGNDTLPKLNYEGSEELEEYILSIGRKWMGEPYSIDGWRLDVAADLGHSAVYNHHFWRRFREEVRSVNPDALILAEHYGSPAAWLHGDQWDTVMNYDGFMEPVTWYLCGMEKHSDRSNEELYCNARAFFDMMKNAWSRMPYMSVASAMNELDNHDHSRFITRTNRTVGRLYTSGGDAASVGLNYGLYRAAAVIQMTWPGAPTLYYGDETGVCGWTDPDSRRPYPWGKEDYSLIDFFTWMIRLHKQEVFRRGSLMELYAENGVAVYARVYRNTVAITAVNPSSFHHEVDIPVWMTGLDTDAKLNRIVYTDYYRYNVGSTPAEQQDGYMHVILEPYSTHVYENAATDQRI